jgi:hypothetical protein
VRIRALLPLVALAWPATAVAVVPHYEGSVIEYVQRPTGVAALGDRVVWNGADGIRVRGADGTVRTVARPSDRHGLELELGRDDRGHLVTPVTRCVRGRCAMRRLDLTTGAERRVPAIERALHVAFDGQRAAYVRGGRLYVRGRGGARRIKLPTARRSDRPFVASRDRSITDIDLRGRTVAAVIRFQVDDFISVSQLWLLTAGRRSRLIARIGSGGGVGFVQHSLLDPVLRARDVVVWRQHDEPGERHNYLTRYSRTGREIAVADIGRVVPEDAPLTGASFAAGHLFYATEPLDRAEEACAPYGQDAGPPGCPVVDARVYWRKSPA